MPYTSDLVAYQIIIHIYYPAYEFVTQNISHSNNDYLYKDYYIPGLSWKDVQETNKLAIELYNYDFLSRGKWKRITYNETCILKWNVIQE